MDVFLWPIEHRIECLVESLRIWQFHQCSPTVSWIGCFHQYHKSIWQRSLIVLLRSLTFCVQCRWCEFVSNKKMRGEKESAKLANSAKEKAEGGNLRELQQKDSIDSLHYVSYRTIRRIWQPSWRFAHRIAGLCSRGSFGNFHTIRVVPRSKTSNHTNAFPNFVLERFVQTSTFLRDSNNYTHKNNVHTSSNDRKRQATQL